MSTSCSTNLGKSNNKFDVLPLPLDSTRLYFKAKTTYNDTIQDALELFENKWYSGMLFALKELILKDYIGDKEIYRFTWLRTFNYPVSIRLEKQGSTVRLFTKVCNGAGGYEPGKIIYSSTLNLTQKQVDSINQKINRSDFWTLQTEMRDEIGFDGSEWIIEVIKENKYHMVVRWTPDNEKKRAFRAIGEYLISLADLKQEIIGKKY